MVFSSGQLCRDGPPAHVSARRARGRNIKALSNHAHGYRLRVGSYRVFFDFDGAVRIVSIEEVKKRDERTY